VAGGSQPEPTWEGVPRRPAQFPPWTDERLVIDYVVPVWGVGAVRGLARGARRGARRDRGGFPFPWK
jgi:hypothetical protein